MIVGIVVDVVGIVTIPGRVVDGAVVSGTESGGGGSVVGGAVVVTPGGGQGAHLVSARRPCVSLALIETARPDAFAENVVEKTPDALMGRRLTTCCSGPFGSNTTCALPFGAKPEPALSLIHI